MHLALEMLLEFHEKMKQTIGDPRAPDIQREREFRMNLIREELEELELALEANDVEKAADGIADLIYVLTGAAVTWGIDIASVFEEVHRSNMTKKPGNKRSDGKVLKDKDFSPPDIAGVLNEVAENYDDGPDGWWKKPTVGPAKSVVICKRCERPKSKSAGCHDGSCNRGPIFTTVVDREPGQDVIENIMGVAKAQAKYLKTKKAMKDIQADLIPDNKANGLTVDGKPYTVNERAWHEYIEHEASDGIPQAIKGEFTNYGAYVFSCTCGRRHAVQAKLGTRGGLADSGTCECMCGKAFLVDFTTKEPIVQVTTIDELRKDQK